MKLNLHKLHLVTCLLENTLFVFKFFFFSIDLHLTRIYLPSLWWQKAENVAFGRLSSIVHLHQNICKFMFSSNGVHVCTYLSALNDWLRGLDGNISLMLCILWMRAGKIFFSRPLVVEYYMAHTDFVLLSIIYSRSIYFLELCLFA